jgi:hypothetical protein
MDIKIIGAGIGAQYLDHYEWLVRYERNGGGQYFHSVSSRAAQSADSAILVAERKLGATRSLAPL